jgi:hypothetical protein
VDHRADIYSLGVVIYEMLTGELPLGRFPAPSQKAAVDARIDEIVFKTLEKERELRQQSANEVKTDVHRMMTSNAAAVAPAAVAIRPSGGRTGTIGFWVMISAVVLPFILWAISERAGELGFLLSALMLVIAFVLGVLGRRETLGKVAFISSFLVLSVYLLFLTWTTRGTSPAGPYAPSVAEPRVFEGTPAGDYDFTTPGNAIDPAVEDVFRKAVTAANESNEAEFLNCIRGDLDGPGKVMTPLECMELFVGEIVKLNTSAVEGYDYLPETIYRGRLTRTAVASDDLWNPVVYSTIRRSSGLLENLIVEFHYEDNRWVGTTRLPPIYRSFSRVEFKPKSGDAAGILKTHLGSYKVFQAVKGNPDVFDILGTGKEAESAKDLADLRIRDLRKSLEKFGMDSALKVISPAVKPEAPWMAEEAPPFQAPKP